MALTELFTADAKVVISPDKMRAWVMLPPPPAGVQYTPEAITAWLPQHGVVHGVRPGMVKAAAEAQRYFEMLEVARGEEPLAPVGGGYTLHVEKKPFSGLRGNPDGALFYDDMSFLQEVEEGAVLADLHPAREGLPGQAVTGEEVPPPAMPDDRTLTGSGFVLSADGLHALAPSRSHVSVVGEQLVVTPLLRLEKLAPQDGPVQFEGNVLVAGDVLSGAEIEAGGSVFVQGRTGAAKLRAARNLLLSGGMRAQDGFGKVNVGENVWGLCFESADIEAGGDICTNHLVGCEARCEGKALILGGRAQISSTSLYAKGGVVAGTLGDTQGSATTVAAGMEAELIERSEMVTKKLEALNRDINVLSQNITAHERVNRGKTGGGKDDPAYREMVEKRDKMRSVLGIIEGERTRLKRTMDQFATTSIIVRETAYPGVTVVVDTRSYAMQKPMQRVKFRRKQDVVEMVPLSSGR